MDVPVNVLRINEDSVSVRGVGHLLVLLVEALHCMSEGHVLDCWWYHWNISLTSSFSRTLTPGHLCC